jgi:hypothetical protein
MSVVISGVGNNMFAKQGFPPLLCTWYLDLDLDFQHAHQEEERPVGVKKKVCKYLSAYF